MIIFFYIPPKNKKKNPHTDELKYQRRQSYFIYQTMRATDKKEEDIDKNKSRAIEIVF